MGSIRGGGGGEGYILYGRGRIKSRYISTSKTIRFSSIIPYDSGV